MFEISESTTLLTNIFQVYRFSNIEPMRIVIDSTRLLSLYGQQQFHSYKVYVYMYTVKSLS